MASHGFDDDDFDIVDANEWNQYDSYAMRRAPQHTQIHMTQQMTTKVADRNPEAEAEAAESAEVTVEGSTGLDLTGQTPLKTRPS